MALIETPHDLTVARHLLADEIAALTSEREAIERGLEAVQAACNQSGRPASARVIETEARIQAALNLIVRQIDALGHAIACLDEAMACRDASMEAEILSLSEARSVAGVSLVLVDGDHVGSKLVPHILAHGDRIESFGRAGAANAWKSFAARNPGLPIDVHSTDDARGATDGAIVARIGRLSMLPAAERPKSVLIVSNDKGFDTATAHFAAAGLKVRRIAVTTLAGQTRKSPKPTGFQAVVEQSLASGPIPLSDLGLALKALGLRQKHLLTAVRSHGYATWLEEGSDSIWWIGRLEICPQDH